MKKTLLERFESKIYYSIDGCWIWTDAPANTGYGRIIVNGKPETASRISYELYKGPIKDLCVLHHCDNRLCVNPNHLFLGSRKDNSDDKVIKGRAARKLTPSAVKRIIELKNTMTHEDLANELGISRSLVTQIYNGTKWKHITRNL